MDRGDFGRLVEFFLRAEGRVSRREYCLGILLILTLDSAGVAFVFSHAALPPVVLLLLGLSSLPLTIGQFVLVAKRCHDLGLPGGFCVLLLVPLIGILWLLALMFVPGSAEENRYGPPPAFRSD